MLPNFTALHLVLPLDSEQAVLALAGGKGTNLARLARLGLPVPAGFIITTAAYNEFITANAIAPPLTAALAELSGDPEIETQALDVTSARIRALFTAGSMPDILARQVVQAYHGMAHAGGSSPEAGVGQEQLDLPFPAVAVRSSATAEDLPGFSFAGQQDTYLNIIGEEALLKAVVRCWSSLWTARAIGYRRRNGIPHDQVSLAVVVQQMVPSQVSGVLFTANPLTGLRSETVIDAAFGLGEALVSGLVEPDHYVVDAPAGRIRAKTLGAKALSIRSESGGGTRTIQEDSATAQAASDEQILALTRLGQQVQAEYHFPQDIEWALCEDQLYLLQSRPITALYPLPENPTGEPRIYFSFGAVQGMLDPLTPLGMDALRMLAANIAALFRINVTLENQTVLYPAGERLWINFTALIRNSIGRRITRAALPTIEPSISQALDQIWDDPKLIPTRRGIRPQSILRLATFMLPLLGNVILNLANPERRRAEIVAQGERLLAGFQAQVAAIDSDRPGAAAADAFYRIDQRLDIFSQFMHTYLLAAFSRFVSGVATAMASLNFVNQTAGRLKSPDDSPTNGHGWSNRAMAITRGLPNNPTTEMDLHLWKTAQVIQGDPAAQVLFHMEPSTTLAALYLGGELPSAAQKALAEFLTIYGGRGLGEIDLGRPRWKEDPTQVIQMLKAFLPATSDGPTPPEVFARSAAQAEAAIQELIADARVQLGPLAAHRAKFFARRVRGMMGIREAPKFFAVRMLSIIRTGLLRDGNDLVSAGILSQADDLFYLSLADLRAFARREPRDWRAQISQRRALQAQEQRRRQSPRLLLSDGRAFYEGLARTSTAPTASTLHGSPVSPGVVEGTVHVVLDPRSAHLLPGEILVCPGTDPTWTPLFLTAGGLLMEVGGMMTHGAVVAREYGIPAIVGIDQATTRLRTGQRVRLDGSSGQVTLLTP
jgi:pyruvate,water dikinase